MRERGAASTTALAKERETESVSSRLQQSAHSSLAVLTKGERERVSLDVALVSAEMRPGCALVSRVGSGA